MSAKTNVAVVDGANVAYAELGDDGRPRVANLEAVCAVLKDRGYEPIVIVDAALRHEVGDPEALERLLEREAIRQAPAGTDADYFLLETAERFGAQVVSNDNYGDFRADYPWIEERRVPLMIVRGEVEFYDPALEAPPEEGSEVEEEEEAKRNGNTGE